jgi:oligopeptide transport system ATP-binding protein
MYLGKIVETGSYGQLYTDPKHPYTQALLSAVPTTDTNARKERIILTGDVPSPIDPPSGCRFHPRCPKRMAVCDQTEPELKDVGDGYYVACHLY